MMTLLQIYCCGMCQCKKIENQSILDKPVTKLASLFFDSRCIFEYPVFVHVVYTVHLGVCWQ